jgi:glucose-1-phosphate thymidylyltransferase
MNQKDLSLQLCLERDCRRCRHCGVSEGLEVIQLSTKYDSWLLSNLITLCSDCKADKEASEAEPDNNLVGVLLAGGKGTRIAPLTKYFNKHAVPVGIVPMVFYPLRTLRALGVKRVMVVIDRENVGSIVSMLGSGKEFGLDLTYRVQEGAGGISEALYLAKDYAKPGDRIVCILGDNIFDPNGLDDSGVWSDKPCVWVKQVPNPQDYGVAEVDGDRIVRIIEKPKVYVSNWAVLGLYAYNYDVFSVIDSIKPSDRGELEISCVNDYYASSGQLEFEEVNGFWGDAGSSLKKYTECFLYGAKVAKVSAEEITTFHNLIFDEK